MEYYVQVLSQCVLEIAFLMATDERLVRSGNGLSYTRHSNVVNMYFHREIGVRNISKKTPVL